jgi:hypothetical protein
MREKRPRITNSRIPIERQEGNVYNGGGDEQIVEKEDKSWGKGKLPDIEFDDLWQKDTFEPVGMTDYNIEPDLKPMDGDKGLPVDPADDITYLKDIYNNIDFDHTV